MDDGSIVSFLILFALLLLAAYFAACETAFAAANRIRLKTAQERGDRRARRALGLTRQQCAVIGDQVFTDVLGARLSRLYCIQVLPIQEEKGHPFLAFKRIFEKKILRRYRRRKENVE